MATYQNINQLIVSHNNIQTLESLNPLKSLQNLEEVDFSENPVAAKSGYRDWLFNNIKGMEIVDGTDKEGNIVEEESEFGEQSDDE